MPTLPRRSVGLYFASTNGDTARIAALLVSLCDELAPDWEVESFDVAAFYLEDMPTFDLLLLGASTWNTGQLQRDWEAVFPEFDSLDLTDIPVALFGPGDQAAYPDTFADALAFFADKLQERGARLVGRWPLAADPAGYTFASSWALEGDHLLGLALDEINQPDATLPRLRLWLAQLRRELA